ncbi:MAG: hypothetical protein JWM68_3351 [Verrucomicrobiales bacterium]|nr:hypothetical protein [Verrucomicrobiales bacterium]
MHLLVFFSLLLGGLTIAQAADTNPVTLPAKEKLKIYLLMGQSNMAGRGIPEKEDLTPHARVLLFTQSNQWQVAVEPFRHNEKGKIPGVGPGLAFGKAMAETNSDVVIGLVPCAVGGTPLRRWVPGADLYTNAIARAKAVAPFGTLSGIIWHQGEGDAGTNTTASTYSERLTNMIHSLRKDLNAPNLPFVVGEIGEFCYDRPGDPLPFARVVNEALRKIPEKVPFTGCALSHGLRDKGDLLHFSSEAQRELGRRYAVEMLKVQGSLRSHSQ